MIKTKGTMTKGAIESEISRALTQWEKDFLGRGSVSVKSDVLRDIVLVTLQGVLTPAEYKLCEDKDGMITLKKTRNDLVESGVEELREIIFSKTGQEVVSFHTDFSTSTGERIMIFRVAGDIL